MPSNMRPTKGYRKMCQAAAWGGAAQAVVTVLMVVLASSAPSRAELGLLAEVGTGAVIFDASTGQVVGSVPIAPSDVGPLCENPRARDLDAG